MHANVTQDVKTKVACACKTMSLPPSTFFSFLSAFLFPYSTFLFFLHSVTFGSSSFPLYPAICRHSKVIQKQHSRAQKLMHALHCFWVMDSLKSWPRFEASSSLRLSMLAKNPLKEMRKICCLSSESKFSSQMKALKFRGADR